MILTKFCVTIERYNTSYYLVGFLHLAELHLQTKFSVSKSK